MESKAGFASAGMFFAIVTCLACWLSAFPTAANAQGQDSQGQNAVCTGLAHLYVLCKGRDDTLGRSQLFPVDRTLQIG